MEKKRVKPTPRAARKTAKPARKPGGTRIAAAKQPATKPVATKAVAAKPGSSKHPGPRKVARARTRKLSLKRSPANRRGGETPRHPRKPAFGAAGALWGMGLVGGIMVVTAALWSAQKPLATPPPVAVQQAQPQPQQQAQSDAIAKSQPGAGANPPNPQQVQAPPQPARVPAAAPAPQAAQPVSKAAEPAPATGPFAHEFNQARSLEIGDRVGFWSRFLWKSSSARDKLAPLGRGPRIADAAPLLPSRYDCTTFVETVAALARSGASSEFFDRLIAIRYRDSRPDFLHRNHFPEADWIPNNQKSGVISDATEEVAKAAGLEPRLARKMIDRPHWLAQQAREGKVSRSIASAPDGVWSQVIEAKVPYIAIADLERVLGRIPNGAIVNLVRKSDDRHPVLITHQGFVVRENGQVLLRHASSGGNVRTVGLVDYLRKAVAGNRSWPIVGINLNRLRG